TAAARRSRVVEIGPQKLDRRGAEKVRRMIIHSVELMVRRSCGSCKRVHEQIKPVVAEGGAEHVVRNVDHDQELAAEYGDRVPVVVVDGEEFSAWEVDNEELAAELS